jgi:hypothetical protein
VRATTAVPAPDSAQAQSPAAGVVPEPRRTAEERPLPTPDRGADRGGAERTDGPPALARRVPQANLAAGLRRGPTPPPAAAEPPALRDPGAARDALTRFQASQRAARATVDEEVTR